MEFVERSEPNDVIEWPISYINKDEGRVIRSAILHINGEIKGEPIIIENEDDLFPTLHISSSGAKVESGYQDMHYSKNITGKAEILFYSYQTYEKLTINENKCLNYTFQILPVSILFGQNVFLPN